MANFCGFSSVKAKNLKHASENNWCSFAKGRINIYSYRYVMHFPLTK